MKSNESAYESVPSKIVARMNEFLRVDELPDALKAAWTSGKCPNFVPHVFQRRSCIVNGIPIPIHLLIS